MSIPTGPPNPFATGGRRLAFGGLLLLAMGVATFPITSMGLLASAVIADFDVSRAQVGLVVTVIGLVSAFASPLVGAVTDRVGGRAAILALFAACSAAFLIMAAAPEYGWLFGGAALAGLAQASANPSTNKLIALHIPLGKRGLVTGVKQSGVQMAVFVGGLTIPVAAAAVGWKTTLALVALAPLAALPAVLAVLPADHPAGPRNREHPRVGLPPSTYWLAGYGFLAGFGGSVTFFVPLFVEEALGMSSRAGGAAAAVIGLAAFFARIAWARATERTGDVTASLGSIAVLSVAASGLFWLATTASPAFVWLGAAITGLSASAWNSVGMLAVMADAGPDRAGKASGVVLLGFLGGLGLGPPVFGATVDATGSYATMWAMSVALFAAAALLTGMWRWGANSRWRTGPG